MTTNAEQETRSSADDAVEHADERLSVAAIASGSLIAASHIQRYRLAAETAAGKRVVDLCCGTGYGSALLAETATSVTGVDISAEAIEAARKHFADGERVRFEVGDAVRYIESLSPEDVDLVVCFEGIEHVPDPHILADALKRLVNGGTGLLMSVPNSVAFEEDNEYHATNFSWSMAEALLARISPDVVRLDQVHADSSMLIPDGLQVGGMPQSTIETDRPVEAGLATHWVFGVGLADGVLRQAATRVAVTSRPHHYAYMRALERANQELWRVNTRLAETQLGVHDAAAGRAARLRDELRTARKRIKELEEEVGHARNGERANEALFRDAQNDLILRDREIRDLQQRAMTVQLRIYHKIRAAVRHRR